MNATARRHPCCATCIESALSEKPLKEPNEDTTVDPTRMSGTRLHVDSLLFTAKGDPENNLLFNIDIILLRRLGVTNQACLINPWHAVTRGEVTSSPSAGPFLSANIILSCGGQDSLSLSVIGPR